MRMMERRSIIISLYILLPIIGIIFLKNTIMVKVSDKNEIPITVDTVTVDTIIDQSIKNNFVIMKGLPSKFAKVPACKHV